MRLLFICFIAYTSLLGATYVSAEGSDSSDLYEELVVISSDEIRIIQVASKKFHELHPDWNNYQIAVVETDTSFEVTFWRPEMVGKINFVLPEAKGQPPQSVGTMSVAHGALVIELEKKTLRITQVSHIK